MPSPFISALNDSRDLALLGESAVCDSARRRHLLAGLARVGVRTMSRAPSSELAAACQTDAGRVRTNNEDLFLCDPERGVFAVIDGVGGQVAGGVAAAIARRV